MSVPAPGPDDVCWTAVEVPDAAGERTLRAVTASATGPVAVGDGGIVLQRVQDGWATPLERVRWDGRRAPGNDDPPSLRCADATMDGERVWFAGASGTLGVLDARSGRIRGHSRPRGFGTTIRSLAVSGTARSERLAVADASGRLLRGRVEKRWLNWTDPVEPVADGLVRAVTVDPHGRSIVLDSSGAVFRSTTAERWERLGRPGGALRLHDVAASRDRVLVGGNDGLVAEYRDGAWHTHEVGPGAIRAVATAGTDAIAVTDHGRIHSFRASRDGVSRWVTTRYGGSETLWDASLEPGPVAVGTNGSFLEERSAHDHE